MLRLDSRRWWRTVCSVSLMLWPVVLSGCKAVHPRDDQKEILRLEHLIVEGWAKHDVSAIEPLIADDLQYWSFGGQRRGKPDMIRAMREADEGATRVSEPIVRLYNETAIYTARIIDEVKRADGGTRLSGTCVTDVFVKRGSTWQLVASHESLVPDSPSAVAY